MQCDRDGNDAPQRIRCANCTRHPDEPVTGLSLGVGEFVPDADGDTSRLRTRLLSAVRAHPRPTNLSEIEGKLGHTSLD